MFADASISCIAAFLDSIGISVQPADIMEPTFLPGLQVRHGVLYVDEARLLSSGDVLHEAGHLAILPDDERRAVDGDFGADGGMEMAAMAWSYAAAVHLNLNPSVVFHDKGYKGSSEALLQAFQSGAYVGLPMLQWLGLADAGDYPHMRRWTVQISPRTSSIRL